MLDRDKNSLTGDEACGWAYINLDLIAEGQVTEQWVQLRGVPSGELRVRLLALSGTDDSNAVRPVYLCTGILCVLGSREQCIPVLCTLDPSWAVHAHRLRRSACGHIAPPLAS